jgi:hypothetical protein
MSNLRLPRRRHFLDAVTGSHALPALPCIAVAQSYSLRATTKLLVTFAMATLMVCAGDAVAQQSAVPPDFSGVWGHPYWPSFEPPASGPGPVTNRSRVAAGPQAGRSNGRELVGDYTNSILKPWASDILKKRGEVERSGMLSPTPYNQCWPQGVPFILFNFGMQMLQQPDKIVIFYFSDQFRQVRMNQQHPAKVTPSWHGDSVGHYEGDTLVIDTIGIKADRPFAMVDMYGTPHTEALHVVERYRLVDYEVAKEALDRNAKENIRFGPGAQPFDYDPNYRGKHLQLELTVEDEGTFTRPWSATVTYARPRVVIPSGWSEFICAENRREHPTGAEAEIPHADKPDF